MSDRPNSRVQAAEATLAAERGFARCRCCPHEGMLGDFITVQYGGTLLYALCLTCVKRGEKILVGLGEQGVEIRRPQSDRIVMPAAPPLGVLKKRLK